MQILPRHRDDLLSITGSDFSRTRKLPLPQLIAFVLSLTASRVTSVDECIGQFFKSAITHNLWPEALTVDKSAITRARKKLPWTVFEELLPQFVSAAYQAWPDHKHYSWKGFSVFAIDGSRYHLPATDELKHTFDPFCGLNSPSLNHFPQCLVSTVIDVFRRIPIARSIVGLHESHEREQAKKLLPAIPKNGVVLMDRGYPSYDLLNHFQRLYQGFFVFRSPARSTFPGVEKFIRSGQSEAIINVGPSANRWQEMNKTERIECAPIELRVMRLTAADGSLSVLITNLKDRQKYPVTDIQKLYYQRWRIEEQYRDEKTAFHIEQFHSKNRNGILQELYAILIMTVITRTLMTLSATQCNGRRVEPQFKHSLKTLADGAAVFISKHLTHAFHVMLELITEIRRVKYYRPKQPRKPQPRVCKKTVNKWAQLKRRRMSWA